MTTTHASTIPSPLGRLALLAACGLALAGVAATQVRAQAVSPTQRATAQQVAQAGVPIEELAPAAPDEYTVKRGDTLWAISRVYLLRPWRWPELWGMNMQEVRNPHRIYPGQVLVLDKSGGRATLRMRGGAVAAAGNPPTETIRVSPRTRFESLADNALPTLQPHLIEPFLDEPLIVDEATLLAAPRIVATQDERVLISRGDRAYVRTSTGAAPLGEGSAQLRDYRVFRSATPLRDPDSKAILGYEAEYVGKAELVRGEAVRQVTVEGKTTSTPIAATFDIVSAKGEMRVGDRLLPEPPRQLVSYVPRAPEGAVAGSIVSIYGSAVVNAAQSQIVVINRGTADGIESGHVLAILKNGATIRDRTESQRGTLVKLPDERIGLMMVFRPFERLSYALILEITDGVVVGDRVVNPAR